jgi:hypothetical protein
MPTHGPLQGVSGGFHAEADDVMMLASLTVCPRRDASRARAIIAALAVLVVVVASY